MKYEVIYTNQFKKDLKLAKKQNKDLNKLYHIVDLLSRGKKLDLSYKDHSLIGDYKGYRECHIEPDWLLVYKIKDEIMVLSLARLGSHSDLF